MESPAAPPAPSPVATGCLPALLRVAGVLLLAGAVGAGFWLARPPAVEQDDPAAIFDYVRDRILDGDGEVLWPLLLPPARKDYATGIGHLRAGKLPHHVEMAEKLKRGVNLSDNDFRNLPPEKILVRENLAAAEEFFRGSRVHQVDMHGPDMAVLHISMRNGQKAWIVRRTGAGWRIDNTTALISAAGNLMARPDEPLHPARTSTRVR